MPEGIRIENIESCISDGVYEMWLCQYKTAELETSDIREVATFAELVAYDENLERWGKAIINNQHNIESMGFIDFYYIDANNIGCHTIDLIDYADYCEHVLDAPFPEYKVNLINELNEHYEDVKKMIEFQLIDYKL